MATKKTVKQERPLIPLSLAEMIFKAQRVGLFSPEMPEGGRASQSRLDARDLLLLSIAQSLEAIAKNLGPVIIDQADTETRRI